MFLSSSFRRFVRFGLTIATLTTACSGPATGTAPANTLPAPVISTPTVPAPTATPAELSTPDLALAAYLEAYSAQDFTRLAQLVTPDSLGESAEAFQQALGKLLGDTLTATAIGTHVSAMNVDGATATATVDLKYTTALVGELNTTVTIPLRQDAGAWHVVYSPAVVWPDLVNGQQLLMVVLTPDRGPILDRNGTPMVENISAYAVGFVPGELETDSAGVGGVARLFGISVDVLNARLANAVPEQYLSIGEAPASVVDSRYGYLFNIPGVYLFPYDGRFYYGDGAAAHVTGYTTYIQAADVQAYREQGYFGTERIGSAGLEAWGESYLAGKSGGQLQLRDANNQFLRMVAQTEVQSSQTVTSTVDLDLQESVQFALGDFPAAAVVIDLSNGQVLAMASAPTFSPNLFDPGNRNADSAGAILSDERRPAINHATQASYPAGSIFKIVTMAAGLTSGLFTPDSVYDCTGTWTEMDNFTRPDWLEGGHGEITLVQGLSGSCNPWFWHVGLNVHNKDPEWLGKTARAFGLGALTGIGQVDETPGQIPDPEWKQRTRGEAWTAFDDVNMAIGQGDVLVTPLQIARMAAAVANGGTLYQPQLVLSVAGDDGLPTFSFAPIAQGTLPLTAEQLAAIQTGMKNVTKEPIGTARNRFRNFPIPVAGKTGTAEDPGVSGIQEPDAWFTGFTYAGRSDRPDIAFAVVVQNQGQGSDFAAPIARRIIEAYFGLNYARYPWEASVGVPADLIATPTPDPNAPVDTPTP